MRFVVVYSNIEEVRKFTFNNLINFYNRGVDLTTHKIKHHLFETNPTWPSLEEILNLPNHLQCEELEISNGNISSHRQLVIDVEVEFIHPVSLPSPTEDIPVAA